MINALLVLTRVPWVGVARLLLAPQLGFLRAKVALACEIMTP